MNGVEWSGVEFELELGGFSWEGKGGGSYDCEEAKQI